jgi:hypothetical protein
MATFAQTNVLERARMKGNVHEGIHHSFAVELMRNAGVHTAGGGVANKDIVSFTSL